MNPLVFLVSLALLPQHGEIQTMNSAGWMAQAQHDWIRGIFDCDVTSAPSRAKHFIATCYAEVNGPGGSIQRIAIGSAKAKRKTRRDEYGNVTIAKFTIGVSVDIRREIELHGLQGVMWQVEGFTGDVPRRHVGGTNARSVHYP